MLKWRVSCNVSLFQNKSSGLILNFFHRNLQYIERDGNEFLYTLQAYPDWLQKKITLLKYFRDYMSQHLLKVSLIFDNKNESLTTD